MTSICSCTWNKEYVFVNKNGTLARTNAGDIDKITLNIFQRFLRSWLGCYGNTHLNVVARALGTALFDPAMSDANKRASIKIASKTRYNSHEKSLLLGEEKLKSGDIVRYEASFCPLIPDRSLFNPQAWKYSFDSLNIHIIVNPKGEKKEAMLTLSRTVHRNGEKENSISLDGINSRIFGDQEKDPLLARVTLAFLRNLASSPKIVELQLKPNFEPNRNTAEGTMMCSWQKWKKMDEYLQPAIAASKITAETIAEDADYQSNIPISIDFMLLNQSN